MYNVGDVIVYGSEGVCKIVEKTVMTFGSSGQGMYYILSPMSNPNAKVFVPCDNPVLISRIQKLLNAQEIRELISSSKDIPEWISDNRLRSRTYKEILQTYDRKQILGLAKLLYGVKHNENGKKRLLLSDEELLKKIIKILHSEFSIVLNITIEEIMPYILGEITCTEK